MFSNTWAEENKSKDCFRVQDISGWNALDDERLIIWSPTQSKPFLVTLINPVSYTHLTLPTKA